MALSLDNIVRVSDSIAATGIVRRDLGVGLFITNDDRLGLGENRVAVYDNFTALAKQFPDGEVNKAAMAWFSQSPLPKNLVIGRWNNTKTPAQLSGGAIEAKAEDLAKLEKTGKLSITISNQAYKNLEVDLTDVKDYDGVATQLQGALTDKGAAVTVAYNDTTKSLAITTTNAGKNYTIDYATKAEGTDDKTDLSALLKLSQATASEIHNGTNGESLPDAWEAILALNDTWYFVMVDHTLPDYDQVLMILSDYIGTSRYMLALQTSDKGILDSSEETSLAYTLHEKQAARTWMTYSSKVDEYKEVSIAARFSGVNFNANNSVITAKFKTLPQMTPDALTLKDIQALEKKRVNYYTKFATSAIYSEGTTCSDDAFIDVRYALDWFVNAIQVDTFNLLKASGKLPQTEQGQTVIVDVINRVCRQALANGMIAGNQVSEAMADNIRSVTGNQNFNGYLPNGYLIWSQPVAEQSLSARNAREATIKKVWLKSSGAIHSVEIIVNLEN